MPKYGLISETDSITIAKTIDLIFKQISDPFTTENIRTTEIGIYNGDTSRYIHELIMNDHRNIYTHTHTAIDNEKDKPILRPFEACNLIIGNSTEVYNQLEDNSQHFIFVDGLHSYVGVIGDFFCYKDKVKVGGYIAFHDTGKHIAPFKDYQSGALDNPDSYISVRKALTQIGLIPSEIKKMFSQEKIDSLKTFAKGMVDDGLVQGIMMPHYTSHPKYYAGWQLIFDEADETDLAGGVTVFKRLF